jgi:HSP20 family protein
MTKFGPFDELEEWSKHVNKIMDEMLNRSFVQFRDCGTWQPTTNVYESQAAFEVVVDLAGVRQEDLAIDCESPTRLVLRGKREQPRPEHVRGALSVHVMEIDEGPFARAIELPEPVDPARVEASYRKGLLWITLPKKTRR